MQHPVLVSDQEFLDCLVYMAASTVFNLKKRLLTDQGRFQAPVQTYRFQSDHWDWWHRTADTLAKDLYVIESTVANVREVLRDPAHFIMQDFHESMRRQAQWLAFQLDNRSTQRPGQASRIDAKFDMAIRRWHDRSISSLALLAACISQIPLWINVSKNILETVTVGHYLYDTVKSIT